MKVKLLGISGTIASVHQSLKVAEIVNEEWSGVFLVFGGRIQV